MSKIKFETSKETGAHKQLSRLAGVWEGTTKTWFEPDVVADESPMRGTIKIILDGRFAMHEYEGSLNGKPFNGNAIYGYHLLTGKFQCAWVDSFHMGTGIMLLEDDKNSDPFSALGSYESGEPNQPAWGWRITIDMESDDKLILTAYNITPEGDQAKATETVYHRKK